MLTEIGSNQSCFNGNQTRLPSNKLKGFTLIELVIVIVLIGILSATALPRFANLTKQASNAANQGVAGALGAAVNIAHAAWIASGASTTTGGSTITMDTTAVHVNTLGWPDGASPGVGIAASATACAFVWNAVLNNPPPSSTTCTATSTTPCYIPSAATSVCTFTYSSNSAITVTYDMSAGTIGFTSAP